MLRLIDIYKKYEDILALDKLNMEIHKGELYGFVGANGAGKTTTIRIITGLVHPTKGEVWIDGKRADQDRKIIKEMIGYVPDFFGVYDNLTVEEYLEFYASAYGIYGKEGKKRCQEVLDIVEIFHMEDRFVDELSRGVQQRLCLARALLHKPKLLVMDEPASGLDPSSRRILKHILRTLCQEDYTILISSHILSELSDMCSNVGIIHQGKMILQGEIGDIICSIDSANPILISIYKGMEQAIAILKKNKLVSRISIERETISIIFQGSREEEAQLLRQMVENGIYITAFRREYNSLEAAFFHLTDPEKRRISI